MVTSIDEKTYKECVSKTFGNKKTMAWGGRRIPPREAINLILSITGNTKGKYGPEDLAVVWAIETNFYKLPRNKGNKRGAKIVSVDIGPAQINYPTWLGPGTRDSLRKTILGTNLKDGQTFNGKPKANLKLLCPRKFVVRVSLVDLNRYKAEYNLLHPDRPILYAFHMADLVKELEEGELWKYLEAYFKPKLMVKIEQEEE